MNANVLLIDLPTFPKGVLSLSLITVAGVLRPHFDCEYLDLNFESDRLKLQQTNLNQYVIVGMKVSSQNFSLAIQTTQQIKKVRPDIPVLWGGELPTLLKEACLAYTDTIITGLFESIATEFIEDLKSKNIKKVYLGTNRAENGFGVPDFSIISAPKRYNSFMGYPAETSRGCTQRCLFCMVLIMQAKNYYVKSDTQLRQELAAIGSNFLNVVDYNVGVDKQHVLHLAELIKKSEVTGWMAEMNIEMLDDDEILLALQQSRCRIIYCGLESVDEHALNFVNKGKTNNVSNYERIIRKVQRYGIDIAAGLILGLENADRAAYERTLAFYDRMGLIYAKFTFLVYNPGTRVKDYMAKRGHYITEEIERYDGLQISFLPEGQEETELYKIAEELMKGYYSMLNLWNRSGRIHSSLLRRMEYFLFSFCYGQAYRDWINSRGHSGSPDVAGLVEKAYTKNWKLNAAEFLLNVVRLINCRHA